MTPRIDEYTRQKIIRSRGYDFAHKRNWPIVTDASFEPQSKLNFVELKGKGKLFFRQALLEIILGENQVSNDLPNGMPLENKIKMIEFLENDLRENLEWGANYLKTKIETSIVKPEPLLNLPHEEPYKFIKTFKQRSEEQVIVPFLEWEERVKIPEYPITTEFSKKPLNEIIPASLALYLIIYKPNFPESWELSLSEGAKILTIIPKVKTVEFQGNKAIIEENYLFQLLAQLVNAGRIGLSNAEFSEDPTAIKISSKYSQYVSRINKALNLSFKGIGKVVVPISGKNKYKISDEYKVKIASD